MVTLKSQKNHYINPYIIGRPINEPKLLCGRQKELSFVWENLQRGEKVTFLHGERRIGKSSLLQNIPNLPNNDDEFAFVSFDLEYYSQNTLEFLLEGLAETIVKQLDINPYGIEIPTAEEIKVRKDIFCNKFLPQIYARLKDTKLVLLLDEFDALEPTYIGATLESLFGQLKNVVQNKNNQQLFAVIFAGRKSTDILNLLKIFNKVPIKEIGLIDDESATKLITEPAASILRYEEEAIAAIINFSSGHPYFIQIICFAIFSRARELEKWDVTKEDVEIIIERSVELAEAGLAWYWEALSVPEKLVFAAVAEAQRIASEKQDKRLTQDPLMLLKTYNLLSEKELELVTTELVSRGFLNLQGNKVKIELVGRWLVKRHPLWQEAREFEKRDPQEIDEAYQIIDQLNQGKKNIADVISPIHKTILNPDNFARDHQNRNDNPSHFPHSKHPTSVASVESQHLFSLQIPGNTKALAKKIYVKTQENQPLFFLCVLGVGAIATFIALISPMMKNNSDNTINQIHPPSQINSTP